MRLKTRTWTVSKPTAEACCRRGDDEFDSNELDDDDDDDDVDVISSWTGTFAVNFGWMVCLVIAI